MVKKYSKIICMVMIMSVCAMFLCACGEKKEENTQKESEKESQNLTTETTEVDTSVELQTDWVWELDVAKETAQLIVVAAEGNKAVISLHEKDENGIWKEILSTDGKIGENGIGKTQEGDRKTPIGAFKFIKAFGIKDNPGTKLDYLKVDNTHYWVDDVNSKYYNQFVSTSDVAKDWISAEHIVEATGSYNYVLATDYNIECTKGAGSAIFLHCLPTGGAGCVAVPEEVMKEIMLRVQEDCILIIDSTTEVYHY